MANLTSPFPSDRIEELKQELTTLMAEKQALEEKLEQARFDRIRANVERQREQRRHARTAATAEEWKYRYHLLLERLQRQSASRTPGEFSTLEEESRRKYAFIVNAAGEFMSLIDREYRYEAVNNAYLAAISKTREQVVGKTVSQLWGRKRFERIIKRYLDRCFSGEVVRYEDWFDFPGQDKRFYQVSYFPYQTESGRITHAAVISHDLTQRKAAEQALNNRLRYERGLARCSRILLVNDKGNTVNRAISHLMEASQTEQVSVFVNQDHPENGLCMHRIHEVRAAPYSAPPPQSPLEGMAYEPDLGRWKRLLSQGQVVKGERFKLSPSEQAILERLNARSILLLPLRVAGQWHGFIGFISHQASRKWGREDVRMMRTASEMISTFLERQLRRKERKQFEARLRQAQKMEAIGTLAGGIAHDFNNILFPIVGYAEMALAAVSKDSNTAEYLEGILKSCKRARDLVGQILSLSRQGRSERIALNPEPVVKEALKLLTSTLPSTISIRHRLEPAGYIQAEPTEVHQVIMNLCTNAFQAMPAQGGILSVYLEAVSLSQADLADAPQAGPGPYLKLTVQDNGKGMDPKTLERIFEPYFTTKQKGEGTGLGLFMVNEIVKNLHGHLRVYSQPGEGTRFEVFFPRSEPPETVQIASPPESPPFGGQERILVVDDEAPIVGMLKKMLKSLGYQVTARTDSAAALEAVQAAPQDFDLLITDVTMPEMSGPELVFGVRKIRPDIPVILCSGHSDPVSAEQRESLGRFEFVPKPILRRELADAIRRALEGGSG